MPKWHKWITDDNEELVDDYQTFKKIARKQNSEDYAPPKRKENLRVTRPDKE